MLNLQVNIISCIILTDQRTQIQTSEPCKKGYASTSEWHKREIEKISAGIVDRKIEKEQLHQNLQKLTKDIDKVSGELKSMGVKGQVALESLCK